MGEWHVLTALLTHATQREEVPLLFVIRPMGQWNAHFSNIK